MKLTMIIIIFAMWMVALVYSLPVANSEEFRSQILDRLMTIENENEEVLRSKRTIGILRQLFPSISKDVNPEVKDHQEQDVDGAGSANNEVKVQFEDNLKTNENSALDSELTPLEDIEVGEDENRNKRFLSFGLGGGNSNAGGSGGGGGGGSGNFLFDIIRLVAGSGATQNDQNAGGKTDEAVPGPITRLFVIANRGISNLVQDIILRLAATSERIVNFKARLITSII